MMTESPAHKALGKKPLTIRHIKNTKACGCFTGNLLATISRARRKASAVGKRRLVRLGGASSHVGAESGASSRNLQWNEAVTWERCGLHVNVLSADLLPER